MKRVPEAIEHINRFVMIMDMHAFAPNWKDWEDIDFIDYQLLIVMLRAYNNRAKADTKGFYSMDAVKREGDL